MGYQQDRLELQFSELAKALDNKLEDCFGVRFNLHPNRPKRGTGANPSFDGLFATTVAFTLGYGSKFGRGYIVNIDIRTLECISAHDRELINTCAFEFLTENISVYVPGRELSVVHDGRLIKIIGDFSLN